MKGGGGEGQNLRLQMCLLWSGCDLLLSLHHLHSPPARPPLPPPSDQCGGRGWGRLVGGNEMTSVLISFFFRFFFFLRFAFCINLLPYMFETFHQPECCCVFVVYHHLPLCLLSPSLPPTFSALHHWCPPAPPTHPLITPRSVCLWTVMERQCSLG